jgi:hypothetical protein
MGAKVMQVKSFSFRILLHKVLSHFLFQVLCLVSISIVSSYKVPDLHDTNWDSALFLTPIGILKNFFSSNIAMKSFYFDVSKGQTDLALWQLVLISLLLIVQITNFTMLLKKIKV